MRKELQASALREFPNPERTGCPDPAAVESLARRNEEMTQSQLHHITHCSPCFQTFLSIREEIRKKRAIRFKIAVAACAAAILMGTIVYTAVSCSTSSPHAAILSTPATLDLRPLSEYRRTDSAYTGAARPVLILPRKQLHLTLYFPVGADEGQYNLQLLDGQLRTLLRQQLSATVENHVVKATADLDLRSLSSGTDTLAIQKTGEDWRMYPVLLQ